MNELEKVIFLKKTNILLLVLAAVLVIVVYKNINISLNYPIVSRKTINLPIEGTWTVSKYVFTGDSTISDKEAEGMMNKKSSFNGKEVKLNGQVYSRPSFKVKVVDSEAYFKSNIKISQEYLGIHQKQVKVITVFSNNNLLDDFVQINSRLIMRYNDGIVFFLTKDGTSDDKVVLNNINRINYRADVPKKQKDVMSRSGLLLGLRSKDSYNGGYDYRTLWISSSYGKVMPIMERKNLFVPRKNGFWEIGVNKKYGQYGERDVVWGAPIIKSKPGSYKNKPVIRYMGNVNSQIMFLGTDFISLDNKEPKVKYFSVLPLDNLNGKGLAFSKVVKGDSNDMVKQSAEIYLGKINKPKDSVNFDNLSTNWAIQRRSGRWILRGRIRYGDFDIIYPISNKLLTSYDDLYPSFNLIKKKVPEAKDAYTSPNRDFIVILTKSELRVYNLNDRGEIGELKSTFELKDSEKSIMSQWAVGKYIDEWNKLFKNDHK